MGFDTEQREFQRLASAFSHEPESIIPFVGAGLSIYGSPAKRLPLWGQLVRQLLKNGVASKLLSSKIEQQVEHLLVQGKMIGATDLILNHLGRANFQQEISAALSVHDRDIPPAIQKLIEVSWSFMITTNLDQFIERSWTERYGSSLRVITHHNRTELMRIASGQRDSAAPVLAKLHGSIEFPESWVLDSNAYRLLVEDGHSSYAEALRNLLLQNVFFVGYGMSDQDFDVLLDQISTIFPFGVGTAFALLSSEHQSSEKIRGVFRNAGIRPIWYDVDQSRGSHPDAGHAGVVQCLTHLVRAWRKGQGKPKSEWLGLPKPISNFEGRAEERKELIGKLSSSDCLGVQIIGSAGTGKTTFIRQVLSVDLVDIEQQEIAGVFAVSFNRYDPATFVNHLYQFLVSGDPTMPSTGVDEQFMVRKICHCLTQHRYIIVLDGVEELLSPSGQICSPTVSRIVMAISSGDSFLICTSRKRVELNLLEIMTLGPFKHSEIEFMSHGMGHLHEKAHPSSKSFLNRVDSHALSLKLALALNPEQRIDFELSTSNTAIDSGSVITTQLLSAVLNMLSPREEALLLCLAVSQKPVPLSQVMNLYSQDIGASQLNDCLVGIDLREPLQALVKKSLIQIEGGNRVGLHPLVHEVMSHRLESRPALGLHLAIAHYLETNTSGELPESYRDCETYFDICYHLSEARSWPKFHDIYHRVLNREHRNYLGNVLGSWDAYRRTAELVFKDKDAHLESYPAFAPSYYLSCVARAYKHLGEPGLASHHYKRCLKAAIVERAPECARYANNFFSLSSLSGRSDASWQLLRLNFATLDWIEEGWRRCWQEEYVLNSAGYFIGLLGHDKEALAFFHAADAAWKRRGKIRRPLFDYYRVYKVEIMLAKGDVNLGDAEKIARNSISEGLEYGWIETELTGRCALAAIGRNLATKSGNKSDLLLAKEAVSIALEKSEINPLPRLRLIILLEAIRYEVCCFRIDPSSKVQDTLSSYLSEVRDIISSSNFKLYSPEMLAAQGWYELVVGNRQGAIVALAQAKSECETLGAALFWRSNNHLVGTLKFALGDETEVRSRFNPPPTPETLLATNPISENLVQFLGNDLV